MQLIDAQRAFEALAFAADLPLAEGLAAEDPSAEDYRSEDYRSGDLGAEDAAGPPRQARPPGSYLRSGDLGAKQAAGAAGPSPVTQLLAGIGAEGMEVYRDLVRGSTRGVLEKCYLYTVAVIGSEWPAACQAYLSAHARRDWELNSLSLGFPEFLQSTWAADHPEMRSWWVELADYERLELQVFLTEQTHFPAGSRGSLECPLVNGTAQIREYTHDVAGWIESRDGSEGPDGPPEAQTWTLFFRDPETLLCRFLNLSPVSAVIVQSWQQGLTSSQIAETLAPQLGISLEACRTQLTNLAKLLAARGALRMD